MHLAIIVAAARNGVIVRGNSLPWHLPGDLKYFKRITMGKPVVMGRKTFESIGRPLPGRTNVVISRNPRFSAEGVQVVASLEQALELAAEIARSDGVDELVVIGGEQIYREALPRAQRLYLRYGLADMVGDRVFPRGRWYEGRVVSRERHAAGGANAYDYSFVVFERR